MLAHRHIFKYTLLKCRGHPFRRQFDLHLIEWDRRRLRIVVADHKARQLKAGVSVTAAKLSLKDQVVRSRRNAASHSLLKTPIRQFYLSLELETFAIRYFLTTSIQLFLLPFVTNLIIRKVGNLRQQLAKFHSDTLNFCPTPARINLAFNTKNHVSLEVLHIRFER